MDKLYDRAPKITVAATIAGAVLGDTTLYFADQQSREIRELNRLERLSYASQVQSLNETHKNLQSLIEFVDDEKRKLQLSEQALQSIKSEHERLKPLVESDRKVIDALFAAQEARNQVSQNTERWIGIGLGVLASLLASIVWAVAAYVVRKNKHESEA